MESRQKYRNIYQREVDGERNAPFGAFRDYSTAGEDALKEAVTDLIQICRRSFIEDVRKEAEGPLGFLEEVRFGITTLTANRFRRIFDIENAHQRMYKLAECLNDIQQESHCWLFDLRYRTDDLLE